MDVLEQDEGITFLKRVKPGASANSYGIHVASLAGIPPQVVNRAREILVRIQESAAGHKTEEIGATDILVGKSPLPPAVPETVPVFQTPGLFSDEELVLDEILSADIDSMTPLQALQLLARWKKSLSGR
jgi:DNA mismatch repair protein MutS